MALVIHSRQQQSAISAGFCVIVELKFFEGLNAKNYPSNTWFIFTSPPSSEVFLFFFFFDSISYQNLLTNYAVMGLKKIPL